MDEIASSMSLESEVNLKRVKTMTIKIMDKVTFVSKS